MKLKKFEVSENEVSMIIAYDVFLSTLIDKVGDIGEIKKLIRDLRSLNNKLRIKLDKENRILIKFLERGPKNDR